MSEELKKILKVNLAHPTNYASSKARDTSLIKYIVIHYTGNDYDTDEANGNYFHNNANIQVSAHYFVDDDSITQSVPEDYTAWHCGAVSPNKSIGGGKFFSLCTNANSIGIEMCDRTKDGKFSVTDKTLAIVAPLVADIMSRYNIPIDNVIRHWDVTGKLCPAYWAMTESLPWEAFKQLVVKERLKIATPVDTATPIYQDITATIKKITLDGVYNLRGVPSKDGNLIKQLKAGTEVSVIPKFCVKNGSYTYILTVTDDFQVGWTVVST